MRIHRLSNIGLLHSADIGEPSLSLNQPIDIMSAVEKKSDTTTGKTALELLEEDDEDNTEVILESEGLGRVADIVS